MDTKKNNTIVGDYGERLACGYLKKNGYKIIKTKYKNTLGEIDIISKLKDIIVFIEVKFRNSDYFGRPSEAVNPYKQNKIRLVATSYLKSIKALDSRVRFDVIEILEGKINHIENCF